VVLSEIRKLLREAPPDTICVALGLEKFEAFLKEVATGVPIKNDFVSQPFKDYYMVPHSVKDYINATHSKIVHKKNNRLLLSLNYKRICKL